MNTASYTSIHAYLTRNPIAIVGTLNPDGSPHGAVVYVCPSNEHPTAYFITKQATAKLRNIREHDSVSLTVANSSENSTLQASGRAFEVHDAATIDMVMKKIDREHASAKDWLPPLAKLRAGAYVVVGIELMQARLAQFEGMTIGDEHIFTAL